MSEELIRQQIEYYRARAGEYDEWFLRQGRYDRGASANERWFAEVDQVQAALERFGPSGRVLELACGTGLWTERLLPHATRLVAVDAAPEALALNRSRLNADARVEYILADLFAWRPDLPERFDVVFFAFWLSHVPRERFRAFWQLVSLHRVSDSLRLRRQWWGTRVSRRVRHASQQKCLTPLHARSALATVKVTAEIARPGLRIIHA
jgi:SAM-dependent methyltransferase